MRYSIAAIPTKYKGVAFRSRLEAKWAAMFDLLKWRWEYEPLDLPGWSPDFLLETERPRRDGTTRHFRLLAEVKPYASEQQFDGHVFTQHLYGHPMFECDACIGLGISPSVSLIEIESDSGSTAGASPFGYLVSAEWSERKIARLWRKACNRVQWKFGSDGKRC